MKTRNWSSVVLVASWIPSALLVAYILWYMLRSFARLARGRLEMASPSFGLAPSPIRYRLSY